jgi:outer membrane protein OmpA-like peptidoglycan-associated protein
MKVAPLLLTYCLLSISRIESQTPGPTAARELKASDLKEDKSLKRALIMKSLSRQADPQRLGFVSKSATVRISGDDSRELPYIAIPVLFQSGSYNLLDDHQVRNLKAVLAIILSPEMTDVKFSVEGHSSAEGDSGVNQALSEERAKAVMRILVEQGVPSSRLTAVGRGSAFATHPATASEEELQSDRRVLIVRG